MTHDQAREGTQWTPSPEQIEKAARVSWYATNGADAVPWGEIPERWRETLRDRHRAVLAAVGPDIATAERDRIVTNLRGRFGVTNRAADWIAREDADR